MPDTPKWIATVQASGSILDPEFVLESTHWPSEPRVVECDTRLDLFGGQVVLFFSGARLVPFLPEPHESFPYHPLINFLVYRSRVNYNIIHPERMTEFPSVEPSQKVTFALSRFVQIKREETRQGRVEHYWHYETVPAPITVAAEEFEDLLSLCTFELYLALTYYLIGCENPRYFLVEFYKALESIEVAFGGEAKATEALKPYGLEKAHFKGLKNLANDRQRRTFNVGRHAPKPGTDFRTLDLRRLLEEPESRKVFAESVAATRETIDAYFGFIRARRP